MSDLTKRIKQSALRFRNDMLLGQEMDAGDAGRQVLHRMNLEFDEWPEIQVRGAGAPALVSKMIAADVKIILYLRNIIDMLPPNATNKDIDFAVGRLILREVWWFNKGVPTHETTLEHILSPESVAATLEGYEAGRRAAEAKNK